MTNPVLLEHGGKISFCCSASYPWLARSARLGGCPSLLWACWCAWRVRACEELQDWGITLFKMLLATHSVLYYLTLYPFTRTLQFLTILNLFTIKLIVLMQTLGRKDCDCLWKIQFKKLHNTAEHEIGFSTSVWTHSNMRLLFLFQAGDFSEFQKGLSAWKHACFSPESLNKK